METCVIHIFGPEFSYLDISTGFETETDIYSWSVKDRRKMDVLLVMEVRDNQSLPNMNRISWKL